MVIDMNKKTAKDIAFDKERMKLNKQNKELKESMKEKDETIKSLMDKISDLENMLSEKDKQIEVLLVCTKLTHEDLMVLSSLRMIMDVCEKIPSLNI